MVSNPKLDYIPLTNSGCESEFAKLDNRIKITGRTTSVQTLKKKYCDNKCISIGFKFPKHDR